MRRLLGTLGTRAPDGTGQEMARIPSVADGRLQGTAAGGAGGLAVGSAAWFAWLADDAVRSFSFRSPAGTYTARKERRRRGGAYWVAYRTAGGRQRKVYLGKAGDLSLERLEAAPLGHSRPREMGLSGSPSIWMTCSSLTNTFCPQPTAQ